MAEDKDRKSILRAVKERVKQSEELQLTQMIVDAIGERRNRDLGDLLSQIEQDRGWSATLKHLSQARKLPYMLPIGAGPHKTLIEDLKYRETIFSVLDCKGFEPIPITINEILSRLENEDSLIDASQSLHIECESMAIKQIESGDTLFFEPANADSSFSVDTVELLERTQRDEVANLSLDKYNDLISIQPLWYCEKGRQALSQLGIKGTEIDSETLDIVISVIQQEISTTESTEISITEKPLTRPSNPLYGKLLTSISNQDIDLEKGLFLKELTSQYSSNWKHDSLAPSNTSITATGSLTIIMNSDVDSKFSGSIFYLTIVDLDIFDLGMSHSYLTC